MKVCPKCSFSNEECFPTCVWCNHNLVNVASTPIDAGSPEHEQQALRNKRRAIMHRQFNSAIVLYTLVIALSAAVPCLGSERSVLLPLILFFASGLVVGFSVVWGVAGQFSASFLQGGFSLALFMHFELLDPLVFFILGLHIVIPGLLWHWMELITDANR